MTHRVHALGALDYDGPTVLVQQRSAADYRRSSSARGGTPGRLKRVPNTIGLVLVFVTSTVAMFDLYLLVASGLH